MFKYLKRIKTAFKKNLQFYSILANLFTALSISGLAVLGVVSNGMAFPLLVATAILLGFIGLIGRFMDSSVEDLEEDSVKGTKDDKNS